MNIVITTVNNNLKDNNDAAEKIEKLLGKYGIKYISVTLEE